MKSSTTKLFGLSTAILLTAVLTGCVVVTDSSFTMDDMSEMEEANKKTALAFYRPGITIAERDAMIHPGYIQHNPAAVKFAEQQSISAKAAFPLWMQRIAAGGGEGPELTGPRPPAGQQAYMAVAEGDKVFLMHQRFAQDPNEQPGTFYEYFTWGMFGFKDGLIHEHWDGNVITLEQ